MKLKSKLLLMRIHNNFYCKNLKEFLTEMVEKEKISYQNLKYIYNNLYKNKSAFIRQNIFPVGEFLSKGYSKEEAEILTEDLKDAKGATIWCYEEKEVGNKYNKLFYDLLYIYDLYSQNMKNFNSKELALKETKEEFACTIYEQREYLMKTQLGEYMNKADYEKYYEKLIHENEEIATQFRELCEKENIEEKDRVSVAVAGAKLGGIELRNSCRKEGNLDGEMEKSPYTTELEKLIATHTSIESTLDKIYYCGYKEYEVNDEEEYEENDEEEYRENDKEEYEVNDEEEYKENDKEEYEVNDEEKYKEEYQVYGKDSEEDMNM